MDDEVYMHRFERPTLLERLGADPLNEKSSIKYIEEHINQLNKLIAESADETSRKRNRIMSGGMAWELQQIEIQQLESLHIVRTYDMRRQRYQMELAIRDLDAIGPA